LIESPSCENKVLHYYGDGEFDFVSHETTRQMLKNAHWAVTQCASWNWLRIFNETSFMFSTSPNLDCIVNKMAEQPEGRLHSGSSFALVMRSMEYIAKNGYAAFEKKML
jgi:hypothetical protein